MDSGIKIKKKQRIKKIESEKIEPECEVESSRVWTETKRDKPHINISLKSENKNSNKMQIESTETK